MNLIEAHRSGKEFKRPHWSFYMRLHNSQTSVCLASVDGTATDPLDLTDLEADDYILEPITKLFTEDELYIAIRDVLRKQWYTAKLSTHTLYSDASMILADDISKEIFKEGE